MSKHANLRVCASFEWIFKQSEHADCPQCGFAHYGARAVYGTKCYRYAKTQKPWIDRKMDKYYFTLVEKVAKDINKVK